MMDLSVGYRSIDDAATQALGRTQRDMIRAYNSALNQWRSRVLRVIQSAGPNPTHEVMMKLKEYKDLIRWLQYQFSTLSGAQGDKLYTGITRAYKEAYRSETEKVEQLINRTLTGKPTAERINFSLQNPVSGLSLVDTLNRNRIIGQYDLARDINTAVRRGADSSQISSVVQRGLEKQAGKMVQILHTEGGRVINTGVQDVFEMAIDVDGGEGLEKYWIHHPGPAGGSRSEHVVMNGKAADPDGMFTLPNGHRGAGPGQFGYPEDDIRCYCRMSIRMKEGYESKSTDLSEKTKKNWGHEQKTNNFAPVGFSNDFAQSHGPELASFMHETYKKAPRFTRRLLSKIAPDVTVSKTSPYPEFKGTACLHPDLQNTMGIAKQENDIRIILQPSEYTRIDPFTRKPFMDLKVAAQNSYHEWWHGIDAYFRDRTIPRSWFSNNADRMRSALNKDYDVFIKKINAEVEVTLAKDKIKKGSSRYFAEFEQRRLEKITKMFYNNGVSAVADIVDAGGKGKWCHSEYGKTGYGIPGHGRSYYNYEGKDVNETFANCGEIVSLRKSGSEKSYQMLKTHFPNLLKEFLVLVRNLK